MCLGEEDRGSPTEGPPRAFANRHVSKRRQGSENEVEPSSHRGRKPMKNTEMVKKKKKKTLNSDVISDHIESVFLMFTFERFYGFASCFKKKKTGLVKQNKKQTNKKLPWLCWNEALFLSRFLAHCGQLAKLPTSQAVSSSGSGWLSPHAEHRLS